MKSSSNWLAWSKNTVWTFGTSFFRCCAWVVQNKQFKESRNIKVAFSAFFLLNLIKNPRALKRSLSQHIQSLVKQQTNGSYCSAHFKWEQIDDNLILDHHNLQWPNKCSFRNYTEFIFVEWSTATAQKLKIVSHFRGNKAYLSHWTVLIPFELFVFHIWFDLRFFKRKILKK